MKKILITLTLGLAALFSTGAMANSCANQINYVKDLDEKTKQELIVKCEQAKLDSVSLPIKNIKEAEVVDSLDRWSDISLKFAKAIGVAAKEFGVAVDEFLDTDAGKLTAALIVWKVLGSDITYITFSLIFLLVLFLSTNKLRKAIRFDGVETRKKEPLFHWANSREVELTKYREWRHLSDSSIFFIIASHIVEIISLIFILVNIA